MLKTVKNNLKKHKMLHNTETVLAAISGGHDSMAMLYCLHKLRDEFDFNLLVAHVNHGVRGEFAKRDQKFVEAEAKKLGLEYFTTNIDMVAYGKENKMTAEEAGRLLRYGFFRKILQENGGGVIAVAHNKNDQAETVLHRIIRGTGLDGLRAMSMISGDVVRPLLNVARKDIEDFIDKNSIATVEDHTNLQTIYTRNKIRLELLPYLRENFNPNIIDSLYRLSEIAQSDLEVLDKEIGEKYNFVVKKSTSNSIIFKGDEFIDLDEGAAKRIIRKAIYNLIGDLKGFGEVNIQNIFDLFELGITGKSVDVGRGVIASVSYGDFAISKKNYENLKIEPFILKYGKNILKEWNFIVFVQDVDELPEMKGISTIYIDRDKIKGDLIIRQRKAGDRINPVGMKGSKKIKDIFIDNKIPRDKRNRIPILTDFKDVIWVPEQSMDRNYKVDSNTKRILRIVIKKLEEGKS